MADSFLAYQNPPITDKKLDSESITVGANIVERERIQISGTAATDIAPVSNTIGLFVNVTNPSIPVTGTLTGITNVVHVDDNAGSLTIDNSTLSVIGGGTEAAAMRVTIASDTTGILTVKQATAANLNVTIGNAAGASAVNIQDGGNSLTVDGSVTVSNAAGGSSVNIQDGGNSITIDGTVTANQGGAPWSVTGSGTLTNNNLPPAANNVGVLPAIASISPPVYANNNQVLLSVDTDGNLRTTSAPTSSLSDALFEILQELKDMKELLLSIAG